jgi:hypothetical protein
MFTLSMMLSLLTFDVRDRRSSEATKGTHKRSLWAAPLDGMVRICGFLLSDKMLMA